MTNRETFCKACQRVTLQQLVGVSEAGSVLTKQAW